MKMSKISSKKKESPPYLNIGDHQKYLSRIKKTLYYGKFPKNDQLSLPVTELAAELFSEAQCGRSLDRLHCNDAAKISRNACVSPCSLVLALLYLERLKKCNPEYLEKTAPSDLFLVSLMVSSKFLFDDGHNEDVYMDEWAASGEVSLKELVQLEKDFLAAIDWRIYVNELTFWKKLFEIETSLAKKEGRTRGYYTYTELEKLSYLIDVHSLTNYITKVVIILAATYALGVITIVGSVFLTSQIPGTSLQAKKYETVNASVIIVNESDPEINELNLQIENYKTDLKNSCRLTFGASQVLKTGIFLASIKPVVTGCAKNSTSPDELDSNAQNIGWDWWNVPVMNWLSETADVVKNFKSVPIFYYFSLIESAIINSKTLDLQDHIHKATKTRLQDQLEHSWHKEWTDTTIRNNLIYKPLSYFATNVKS